MDDVKNWLEEGIVAAEANKGIVAQLQFEQLTEIQPDLIDGWLWRAWSQTSAKKAVEYLQKATELDPTNELAARFLETALEFATYDFELEASVAPNELRVAEEESDGLPDLPRMTDVVVGDQATESSEISSPDDEVAEVETEPTHLDKEVADSASELTELDDEVAEVETEPTNLDKEVADSASELTELDDEVAEVETEPTNLDKEADSATEPTELEDEVADRLAHLDEEAADSASELTELEDEEVAESKTELAELEEEVAETDTDDEEVSPDDDELTLTKTQEAHEPASAFKNTATNDWAPDSAFEATLKQVSHEQESDSNSARDGSGGDSPKTLEPTNRDEATTKPQASSSDEWLASVDEVDSLLDSYSNASALDGDQPTSELSIQNAATANAEDVPDDALAEDDLTQELSKLAAKVQSIDDEIRAARGIVSNDEGGGTILVVDDSPTIRKMTRILLEDAGYNVWTANDGIDATKKLIEGFPNLILLDIRMPRMGGYTLCKLLKGHPDTRDIPVILFSANVLDHIRCSMVKCDDYIAKPFEEEDLLHRVRTHINAAVTLEPGSSPIAAPALSADS